MRCCQFRPSDEDFTGKPAPVVKHHHVLPSRIMVGSCAPRFPDSPQLAAEAVPATTISPRYAMRQRRTDATKRGGPASPQRRTPPRPHPPLRRKCDRQLIGSDLLGRIEPHVRQDSFDDLTLPVTYRRLGWVPVLDSPPRSIGGKNPQSSLLVGSRSLDGSVGGAPSRGHLLSSLSSNGTSGPPHTSCRNCGRRVGTSARCRSRRGTCSW